MTKQTFTAFGEVRTSDLDYTFASIDNNGTVRFHQTRAAAERFPRFTRVEVIATPKRPRGKTCDWCHGSGKDLFSPPTAPEPCPNCKGEGRV
jgi:hypothetical protein